jgi:hypothetical protein
MRQRSDLSVEGAAAAERIPVAPDMTEPRVPIERGSPANASSSCAAPAALSSLKEKKGKQT